MAANTLDHVNIVAQDLDVSARFYVTLLGLERRNGPMGLSADKVQWLYDHTGRPIIHLVVAEVGDALVRPATPSQTGTGAIHHVAFECYEYDAMVAGLDARGATYETRDYPSIGLRQVFTTDPGNVMLELNFRGA